MPFQLASRLPRLLQLQRLVLPPSQILEEDRKVYISSRMTQPSSFAGYWKALGQTSENVDFRESYLESLISKGMHRQLANLGWKIPRFETGRSEITSDVGLC